MSNGRAESIDLGIEGYTEAVEVGRGGFATVYRARRVALDQMVAVKVMHGAEPDAAALARFARESLALGALAHHPHIVTVYDGGTTAAGRPYLVMEYVEGGSLADALRRSGSLPVEMVLDLGVKLAGAIETAHRSGVLHRDVKPDNVLRSRYAQPLLADFGISRIRGGHRTESGVITATLAHAPPEILEGRPPTERSDVYSLGSTLYTLLSGRPPFTRVDDESPAGLVMRVLREPVPPLVGNGDRRAVDAVLAGAMAKDPGQRTASAGELGERLRAAQRELGLPVTPLPVEEGAAPPATAVPPTRVGTPTLIGAASTAAGAGTGPRRRARGRTLLVLGSVVAVVLAAAGTGAAVLSGSGDGAPAAPVPAATSQAPAGPPAAVANPAGVEPKALLLSFTDLPGGTGQLSEQLGDIATVLFCARRAEEDGKIAEAAAYLTAGDGPDHYQLPTHVARFVPGGAVAFMQSLRETTTRCTKGAAAVTGPIGVAPPPGGDEAMRATADVHDAIWVRRGDYVVQIEVIFVAALSGIPDQALAPDIAARAVAKIARGTA